MIIIPVVLSVLVLPTFIQAHGQKEEAKAPAATVKIQPVVSWVGRPEYSELKQLAEKVSALSKTTSQSAPLLKILNEYLNPTNPTEQPNKLSLLLETADKAHTTAGFAMVEAYKTLADMTIRLPTNMSSIKDITENDKKVLGFLQEFSNQYATKLRETSAKEAERYRGFAKEFSGKTVEIEVAIDPKHPEKKIKKKIEKAEQMRKTFVAVQVAKPEELLIAALSVLVSACELSEECKALYPLRADIMAKTSILIVQLTSPLKGPLGETTEKISQTCDQVAMVYFPLFSSSLFWSLVSVTAVMLIGVGASILVFSA